MARLGIYTLDFRFYYRVLHLLKEWDVPFVSIEKPDDIPSDVPVVLSSVDDIYIQFEQIRDNDAMRAIRRAVPYLLDKKLFNEIFIGIDPGPKPGVAVLADRVLIEAFELGDVFAVAENIENIITGYNTNFMSIRIGNGDKPNREKIIQELRNVDVPIDIVDEDGTSMPHKTHDNIISAARIANIENFNKEKVSRAKKSKRRTQIEKEFVTIKAFL
jgi:hypothetical protein